jgi:hypothetical protein
VRRGSGPRDCRSVASAAAKGGCIDAGGSSWIDWSCSAEPGSALIPSDSSRGSDARSSGSSSAPGAPRGRRPHACDLRNCGPGRSDPAGRGAQAALAKHRGDRRGRDVDSKLQELASDPEVAPPGVLTTQPEDQVLDRRIEGRRPGRREPRTRLLSRSRCHLTRVSGATRKLFHRPRDRTRADAARKARSAVANRTRPLP